VDVADMIGSLFGLVGRFFSWWFAELAACVPAFLRHGLRGPRQELVLDCRERDVLLRLRGRGGWRELGQVAIDAAAPAASRAACARLLRGLRLRATDVVLRLGSGQVLQRRVELPLAAAENLREVLGFEMDRLTPFRAETVAYDFRIAATDREAQRLTVDVAVAPRAVVDEAVRTVAALGLAPDRVAPAEGGDQAAGFNLLGAADAAAAGGLGRRLNVMLAVLLLLLLAAAVLWPLQRRQEELAALEARLAESRAAAAATDALRERIAAARGRNSFLVQRRQETPLAVAVLAELTERLADDTWLAQLHIGDGQVLLSGYAPAAAALVPTLEDAPLFADVKFDSPVMPDARVGRERFNLSARIAGAGGE
jgi:general secretion pathway protein L